MNSLKQLALTAQYKMYIFIRPCSLGLVLKLASESIHISKNTSGQCTINTTRGSTEENSQSCKFHLQMKIQKICDITVYITKIRYLHILFILELLVILYVAAVCDHIPSLNSTFDSYGALQWRPVVTKMTGDS